MIEEFDGYGVLSGAAIQEILENSYKVAIAMETENLTRQHIEHHPSIETSITDRDMLPFLIDYALYTRNEEMFMKLTGEMGQG